MTGIFGRLALGIPGFTSPLLGIPAGPTPPAGYLFLTDPDGAILTDPDGAYLVEAI